MSYHIMLGGVPIVLHAGAPELSEEEIGGSSLLRMSDGAAVNMQHWSRMAGSISGQGWMPPGLDGLDYSQPLELRSTQVNSIVGAGLVHTLISTPRPDVTPWAEALVGKFWVKTQCTVDVAELGGVESFVMTITAVSGASLYRACWLPVYSVFARKPAKSQSSSTPGTPHGWSISWEET